MEDAIKREKQLKKWNRAWKLRLIEKINPEWNDLFDEFWGAIRDELPKDFPPRAPCTPTSWTGISTAR